MSKTNREHSFMQRSIIKIWSRTEKTSFSYWSLTYWAEARKIAIEQIYPVYKSKLFKLEIMYGLFFTANN